MIQTRKTVYTLNIGNYEPAICELTYPLMKHWAGKIGADFHVISERKFPEFPVVYEKLQIRELAAQHGNEWSIYIDSDALVNPEFFDPTNFVHKDTVVHNGRDMANIRWRYDQYFRRDGRNIGSCNWFTMASDWCLDLWTPLEIPLSEALQRISITTNEHNSGQCKTEHLIDDFTLSRNIARFGLKFDTITEICGRLGWKMPDGRGASPFLFHLYALPTEVKIQRLLDVLTGPLDKGGWALMSVDQMAEYKKKWGLK